MKCAPCGIVTKSASEPQFVEPGVSGGNSYKSIANYFITKVNQSVKSKTQLAANEFKGFNEANQFYN